MIYRELLGTGLYLEGPEEIKLYERALAQVRSLAATTGDSRRIIERARKEV